MRKLFIEQLETRLPLTSHCGVEPPPPPPPDPQPVESPLPPPPVVNLSGTAFDDVIRIDTRGDAYVVVINDVSHTFDPAVIDTILLQESPGRDLVIINAGNDEQAVLRVGSAEVLGGRVHVAVAAEVIEVNLAGVTGISNG